MPLIYAFEAIFTLNHLYSFCVTFSVIIFTFEVYLFWILMAVRVFLCLSMGEEPLEQKDLKINFCSFLDVIV